MKTLVQHAPRVATTGSSCEERPGRWMHALASELFPLCRSITGDGLRATLRRILEEVPLSIHEVPSGTPVLDWTIPDEWNIRGAWIANARGERIVDFARSNLHVMNYSVPIRRTMSLASLQPHLHTLPEHPGWIPYRTTYYRRDWGFCLSHDQWRGLADELYEVCIDATLAPGALSYGELLIPGESTEEFLISCHVCHPSLANDNLSGLAVATALARELSERARVRPTHYSYRFLFLPGTIGAIAWLARNESQLPNIHHGLVLTCLGDAGAMTYKRSRRGQCPIDRAVESVLRESGRPHRLQDFSPYGYDERQYCSPGFNLPVGCLMRSPHGTFPEYHTSADNLDFIRPEHLHDSLGTLLDIVEYLERNPRPHAATELNARTHRGMNRVTPPSQAAPRSPRYLLNLKPKGEPQLGKYGIYEALHGNVLPALWVLNLSDGACSLDDIAAQSALSFDSVATAADVLLTRGLLREVDPSRETI